jgi:hypothetical protein
MDTTLLFFDWLSVRTSLLMVLKSCSAGSRLAQTRG